MPSRWLGTALLCGCLLALPAWGADKKADDADAVKNLDGGKLPPGEYAGKLVSVPGSDGSLTVNVEIDRIQPNPNAAQQAANEQQHIARLESELANARNANEYNRLLQQLANEIQRIQTQAVKSGGKVVKEYKEVDFHTADGVKVRMLNVPTKFDDKGNPKEYTKAELKELKGKDADLPGYEATLEGLKQGDTVRVRLAHPKPAKKDADKDKADDKKDDKTKDKDADMKKGNEVTLIVILAEAPDEDMNKKKKNK